MWCPPLGPVYILHCPDLIHAVSLGSAGSIPAGSASLRAAGPDRQALFAAQATQALVVRMPTLPLQQYVQATISLPHTAFGQLLQAHSQLNRRIAPGLISVGSPPEAPLGIFRMRNRLPGKALQYKHGAPTPRTHLDSAGRPRGGGQASPLFSQSVLQHRFAQRQISDQALQLAVLVLKLFQPPDLGHALPGIGILPAIERRLRDTRIGFD